MSVELIIKYYHKVYGCYEKFVDYAEKQKKVQDRYVIDRVGQQAILFPKTSARKVGYLKEFFSKNIKKKLNKLNSNKYDGCKSINLVCFSCERQRGRGDFENFKEEYLKQSVAYSKNFDKIYLITTSGIYEFDFKNDVIIENDNLYNEINKKTIQILEEYNSKRSIWFLLFGSENKKISNNSIWKNQ